MTKKFKSYKEECLYRMTPDAYLFLNLMEKMREKDNKNLTQIKKDEEVYMLQNNDKLRIEELKEKYFGKAFILNSSLKSVVSKEYLFVESISNEGILDAKKIVSNIATGCIESDRVKMTDYLMRFYKCIELSIYDELNKKIQSS